LALADVIANTVWMVRPDGGPPEPVGSRTPGVGQLAQPIGVAAFGDTIAVVSAGTATVEFFSSAGAPLGSIALAPDLLATPFELLPSGLALVTTYGQDSALVTLRRLDGDRVARFGVGLPSANETVDPAAVLREIREGKVPEPFQNMAMPVGAPTGDVWLVRHTEGVFQRHGPDGTVRATAELAAEEVAPIRAEFFRANDAPGQPGAIVAYVIAYSGVADSAGSWFLLAQPANRSAVLLRIANDGTQAERLVVAESRGARLLLRDVQRDIFYLVNQEDGVIVRVRRPGAQ